MFECLVEYFKMFMYYDGMVFIVDFNVGVVCSIKNDFDIIFFVFWVEMVLK